ncbi:MAG: hypothetical protein DRJ63_08910 [Thermoprotei archaeon]|nr:MAG: hypothetical protein DRJ63_08910 [Thermoprotei archaeon]
MGKVLKYSLILLIALSLLTSQVGSQKGLEKLITVGCENPDKFTSLSVKDKYIYAVGATATNLERGYDILLSCFSLSGELLWSKSYGGEDEEEALDLTIVGDTIVVVGYTMSYGAGDADAFVAALTTKGEVKWFKVFGGEEWDEAKAVAILEDKIYVLGFTASFGRKVDGFLAILSMDGNLEKFFLVGGEDWDELRCIGVSDSTIYIGGFTKSFGEGRGDILLIALSSDGKVLWAKTLGGHAGDFVSDLVIEGSTVYLSGYTESFIEEDDAFIAAFTKTGELQWFTLVYGIDIDSARAIDVKGNRIYVAGRTRSFGEGGYDIFLAVLDLSGKLLAFQTIGKKRTSGALTQLHELAEEIEVKGDMVYVVGYLDSVGEGFSDAFLLIEYSEKIFDENQRSLALEEKDRLVVFPQTPPSGKISIEAKSITDNIVLKDYTKEVAVESPKLGEYEPALKTHTAIVRYYVQILSEKVNYKTGYYDGGEVLVLKAESPIYFENKTRLVLKGWYVGEEFIKDKILYLTVDRDLVIKPVYLKEYYIEVVSNFSKITSGWYPVLTPLVLEAEPEVVLENGTKLIHIGWIIDGKYRESKLAQIVVRKPLVVKPVYERYYLVTIELKHETKKTWVKENSTIKLPEMDEIYENFVRYSLSLFRDQYGEKYAPGTIVKVNKPLIFKAEYTGDYTVLLAIAAAAVILSVAAIASLVGRLRRRRRRR